MNSSPASVVLAAHLALLSSISFGGFPSVLPDVHNFVAANGWVTDREFANFFAVSQVMPGPNMILMMSLIGLKLGGVPGAIASGLATFGPPCVMYYTAFRGSRGGADARNPAQSTVDPDRGRSTGRPRPPLIRLWHYSREVIVIVSK